MIFFGLVGYLKEDITQTVINRDKKDIRTTGTDLEVIFIKEILNQATGLKEISPGEDAKQEEIKMKIHLENTYTLRADRGIKKIKKKKRYGSVKFDLLLIYTAGY